jgi:signal transduction histidine kinase
LIERLRTTGLHIEVTEPDQSASVPMTVGAAAYRIVQEALTNTVKHAGPAKVRVVLDVSDDSVTVTVEDDGRGAGVVPTVDRVGRGLIGMRERVSLLGGTLDAAPRTGGGFRVSAVLPLSPKPGRSHVAGTSSRDRKAS